MSEVHSPGLGQQPPPEPSIPPATMISLTSLFLDKVSPNEVVFVKSEDELKQAVEEGKQWIALRHSDLQESNPIWAVNVAALQEIAGKDDMWSVYQKAIAQDKSQHAPKVEAVTLQVAPPHWAQKVSPGRGYEVKTLNEFTAIIENEANEWMYLSDRDGGVWAIDLKELRLMGDSTKARHDLCKALLEETPDLFMKLEVGGAAHIFAYHGSSSIAGGSFKSLFESKVFMIGDDRYLLVKIEDKEPAALENGVALLQELQEEGFTRFDDPPVMHTFVYEGQQIPVLFVKQKNQGSLHHFLQKENLGKDAHFKMLKELALGQQDMGKALILQMDGKTDNILAHIDSEGELHLHYSDLDDAFRLRMKDIRDDKKRVQLLKLLPEQNTGVVHTQHSTHSRPCINLIEKELYKLRDLLENYSPDKEKEILGVLKNIHQMRNEWVDNFQLGAALYECCSGGEIYNPKNLDLQKVQTYLENKGYDDDFIQFINRSILNLISLITSVADFIRGLEDFEAPVYV